jgi:GNAT superfamily N-acetyltransferase
LQRYLAEAMHQPTPTKAAIRPLCPEDCAAVSNVIHRCLWEVNIRDYGEEHIARMLPTFASDNLPRWFEGAEPYVLVAENQIVATGTVRGRDIQTVFVLPDCQGKGYGKQLMAFLEQRIKTKGFAEATLNSSLTSKHFYIALGYELVAETHGGVGGQMLAMTKRL